MTKFEESWAE